MKTLKRLYIGLVYFFLYAPIIILIGFSFNSGKSRGLWQGFSLHWYQSMLENKEILSAVKTTMTVAVLATLISGIVGTLGALAFYFYRGRVRKGLNVINQVIVINPDIVTAVGFMAVYSLFRLPLGFFSLLLSHIGFTLPYVVLSVWPKLQTMPRGLPEAAMDLGAGPFNTVRHVIIPYIKPGIVSGLLLAFTISIDDFAISFFTAGNGVDTISTMVYSMARRGINPEINAMSTILFALMLVLLLSVNKLRSRENEGQENDF